MARLSLLGRGLSAPVAALVAATGLAWSAEHSLGQIVPLDDDDLQSITLQVMDANPLLSSAPGVKFAAAQRSVMIPTACSTVRPAVAMPKLHEHS